MKIKLLIYILLCIFITQCTKTEEIEVENYFKKIYFDNNYDKSYSPIDIKQTPDSGYIILSAMMENTGEGYTWWNVNLLKISKEGEMQWNFVADEPYSSPVGNLLELNGSYYFFCMHRQNLKAILMQVDLDKQNAAQVKIFDDYTYPLAASTIGSSGILLQSYSRYSRVSSISRLDNSFDELWSTGFNVIEDVEPKIIYHLIQTGNRYAFATGINKEQSVCYFNGFSNYSFSLCFVSAMDGSKLGTMNGFRYDAAISSISNISGNIFAVSGYFYNDNFIAPNLNIDVNSISHIENLEIKSHRNLTPKARFVNKVMFFDDTSVTVYATTTSNNQIVIYFYNTASNELMGTKHIGNSTPYQIAAMEKTGDNIVVLSKAQVMGRFPRIAVHKLNTQKIFNGFQH